VTAGAVLATLGAAGAGLAVGAGAERIAVGRARRRPDPCASEPLSSRHSAGQIVSADDGVGLWVEQDGDPAATLTVVLVHGYGVSMDCWHYQRRHLGHGARLICYDQRGHGRSGRGAPARATIDQLGEDLYAVLAATAPAGPVLLAGHSMGGMTVLALADRHPELFGDRVVAVALLSTAAGRVAEGTLGLPAFAGRRAGAPAARLVGWLREHPALLARARRAGSDLSFLAVRRFALCAGASPALVACTERMMLQTPVTVLLDFLPTLLAYDKQGALGALRAVSTLVLVGESDQLTPPARSRAIVAALPAAELVVLGNSGHMVIMQRPSLVNRHLASLARRSGEGDEAAAPA
jgi:pimeloyl-ACP methyl ester carboxylesterase